MTALPSSILPGSPQFWETSCMFFQVNDRSITQDMCPHRPLGTLAHKWSAGRAWPINSSTWAQQTSHFFSLAVHPSRVYPSQDTVIMLHQATLNSFFRVIPTLKLYFCTGNWATEDNAVIDTCRHRWWARHHLFTCLHARSRLKTSSQAWKVRRKMWPSKPQPLLLSGRWCLPCPHPYQEFWHILPVIGVSDK